MMPTLLHLVTCVEPGSNLSTALRTMWWEAILWHEECGMAGGTKARLLFDEFKSFSLKGNVVDLAVGVIIGAAFGKIVDALVKHVIMPTLGVILPGNQGYLGWKLTLAGQDIPYGLFVGEVVNFLLVSLALFLFMVKFLGWILRSQRPASPAPPPLTREQVLLTEIRDLLRKAQA